MGLTTVDPTHELLLTRLLESGNEIIALLECKNVFKKLHVNLLRRIKLLTPLFEELMDGDKEMIEEEDVRGFELLMLALDSAKEVLNSVNQGSKLFQLMQRERIVDRFKEVTSEIDEALDLIPYHKFEIAEEVREQIELVHAQFKRAKERPASLDLQLELDLSVAQTEENPERATLKRLSEKLQLKTMDDIKKESIAIHELVITTGLNQGDCYAKLSSILKKLRDSVLIENPEAGTSNVDIVLFKHRSPVIPDDFRCPISLELMQEPVIVSTGQTYEKSCIKKWLDAGHKTCPKTQQKLINTALTPNYVLKSLIALWCENNGVEVPTKQITPTNQNPGSSFPNCDRTAIISLLGKLANGNAEQQRAAAGELRLLAKRNVGNRVCIGEAGAIPLLIDLLSSVDPRTQEHAVTALLNLSINDANKSTIVISGAIPDIVEVLKKGSPEGKENAAACLFSLSVIDENKVAIGAAGAIPALIKLLSEGTPRGKRDAATAIFNLCIYQGNKARAVRAGITLPLMRLLKEAGGMVDEALAILAVLSSHQEGRAAIGLAEVIPVLLGIIRSGSPRNKENASAVLCSLCSCDSQQLRIAREHDAEKSLEELCVSGSDRARRKAASVLGLLRKSETSSNL